MRKMEIFILSVVFLSVVMNIIFLPALPDEIATHWNARGKVDGYMQKQPGLFMLSAIIGIIAVVLVNFPRLFEKKIEKYKSTYNIFVIWFLSFLLLINIHIVLWNSGLIRLKPAAVFLVSVLIFLLCFAWKKGCAGRDRITVS